MALRKRRRVQGRLIPRHLHRDLVEEEMLTRKMVGNDPVVVFAERTPVVPLQEDVVQIPDLPGLPLASQDRRETTRSINLLVRLTNRLTRAKVNLRRSITVMSMEIIHRC